MLWVLLIYPLAEIAQSGVLLPPPVVGFVHSVLKDPTPMSLGLTNVHLVRKVCIPVVLEQLLPLGVSHVQLVGFAL